MPEQLRAAFLAAVEAGRVRSMRNKLMPAAPLHRPGALLLGDAFNMRHPLTGPPALLPFLLPLSCLRTCKHECIHASLFASSAPLRKPQAAISIAEVSAIRGKG